MDIQLWIRNGNACRPEMIKEDTVGPRPQDKLVGRIAEEADPVIDGRILKAYDPAQFA